MSGLSLKKADRDDYLVLCDGQMVGTIHKVYRPIPEPWRWFVGSQYPVTGESEGWSVDLEAAKREFKEAWGRRKCAG